ncbi:quinone-dependent dihydroorotate dehydrogenase [Hugenholtzia roseola]|uniref:quinone-dependent dihydroorotate dehydrogenase n=1 Tax=Hugenholtzia roseola TaxID=1002 RepID=UPI00047BFE6A|nr:quinone-dependent dihydroorotate dehydrogenase [Hugenholtzia roseola]
MYQTLLKPLLFQLSPEKAHYLAMDALQNPLIAPFFKKTVPASLAKEVFGLRFASPLGLAAGFDKNAQWIDALADLGFGFVEIGTVTPLPQEGNPKPRLFRLPADRALINRMGFNNAGVEAVVQNLKRRKRDIIVGGNIGKNKITPNEAAFKDYLICFEKLFDYVDYFVVNVSSPNTPNLRALQEKEPLLHLLATLQNENLKKHKPKPILLKIAPDLNQNQLDDILDIQNQTQIAGLIATNTTIERSHLQTTEKELEKVGAGGLSGAPLKQKAQDIVQYLHQKSKGAFPIIGVGGIHSAEDAAARLQAGAALVQVYTGFVYEGVGLIDKIYQKLK